MMEWDAGIEAVFVSWVAPSLFELFGTRHGESLLMGGIQSFPCLGLVA